MVSISAEFGISKVSLLTLFKITFYFKTLPLFTRDKSLETKRRVSFTAIRDSTAVVASEVSSFAEFVLNAVTQNG